MVSDQLVDVIVGQDEIHLHREVEGPSFSIDRTNSLPPSPSLLCARHMRAYYGLHVLLESLQLAI